jgi:SAM-dependent methyltransferase
MEVRLHRCGACSFAVFLPWATGTDEFYSDVMSKLEYTADKWEFLQAIKNISKAGAKKVLDIGCGSGYFLDLIKKHNQEISTTGFEFYSEAVSDAISKGHLVFTGGLDVLTQNGGYDAVCIFQVLEHIAEPVDFLRKIRTLLSDKGILVISVPDASGPVRHFSSALTDIPPHHVSRWCERVFRIGMPKLGYKIIKIRREPLPSYLWDSYLPVMLTRGKVSPIVRASVNWVGLTRIISVLKRLPIKWLHGVAGHSLYVLLEKT